MVCRVLQAVQELSAKRSAEVDCVNFVSVATYPKLLPVAIMVAERLVSVSRFLALTCSLVVLSLAALLCFLKRI